MRERIRNIWRRFRGCGSRGAADSGLTQDADSIAAALPERRPIDPADLARIQQLGRARAIESFEGWQHLEAVRVTMGSLERGVTRGLDWSRKYGGKAVDQTRKAAGWLRNRAGSADAADAAGGAGIGMDGEKADAGILAEASRLARAAKNLASSSYRDAGEWLRTSGLGYTQSALDYLLAHDPATWTRRRAAKALQGKSPAARELAAVQSGKAALAAMGRLADADRQLLTRELYPYDRPGLASSMKAIDLTINLSLGAIVATNLPFTGVAVSLVNMIKTIFRIAHRLHLMSTIYGLHIQSSNALFVVSARILQSLQSWESARPAASTADAPANAADAASSEAPAHTHTPLDPAIVAELYTPSPAAGNESALPALLNATLKKDAYISVPGVGTVGLGKIPLDDARLDACVRRLVSDYFAGQFLRDRYGAARVDELVESYRAVYAEFHRQDFFRVGRASYRDEAGRAAEAAAQESGGGLRQLFRRVSRKTNAIAVDEHYEALSQELDRKVAQIYLQSGLDGTAAITDAVRRAMP